MPVYHEWKCRTEIFSAVDAAFMQEPVLTGLGDPQRLVSMKASAAYLSALGIATAQGRTFRPDEDPLSTGSVLLVSHLCTAFLWGQ